MAPRLAVTGLAQRIYYGEKRKTMKVRVSGADTAHAVFTHEHGSVHVMNNVASQFRKLG